MPRTCTKLTAVAALLLAGGVQAHTLDLSINDDTVSLDYTTQIPKSALNAGAGFLHNQDDGDVYYASLFVADNVNKQSGILAGLGGRFYYIDPDARKSNGTALGLGGFLTWDVPSVPNLSLRSDLYFAPDVLTFGDVEKYVDFSARVQYRLIEQAWVHVGYRRIKLESEIGIDHNVDEGAFVGLLVWF